MRKKTFVWLLAILIVTILLLAVALRPTGVDKYAAMTDRIERLKIETLSRKLPRSLLRDKLSPGKAWDEYNLALNDGVPWNDDPTGSLLARFLNGDTTVDRAKLEQLIADHKQAIDHLRLGAQRFDGQYPYDWERGSRMDLPSLLASRRLANLAVAQAKVWAESGRTQEAADLLLDVSAFARDLSSNAPMLTNLIGFAVYSITFDELRNLILSGKLTQKQLTELAKRLETVERDFPPLGSTFSNETLLSGLTMLEVSEGGLWSERLKEGGLRFALYPRRVTMAVYEEKEGYLRRSEKFDAMNFAAAKKEAGAISAEVAASPNDMIRIAMPDLSRILVAHREALAHLRLLRAGTTFLATGEMPTLSDPFGDNLLHKQEGGKTKIWSIGRDGTDQNGVGNWEGRPDMILEIPK